MGVVFKLALVFMVWLVSLFPAGFLRHPVSITPTATPTPEEICRESSGKISSLLVESSLLGKTIPVVVYTPPCYDPATVIPYPVLYLLHGQSFDEHQWERLGIRETTDQLISTRIIRPMIIVMPGEEAYLEDVRRSKFGDAILTEVIPWTESHFQVSRDRTGRAIGGLSRGSGWAMHIGLAHPDQFVSIGGHSLTQIGGDINRMAGWRKKTTDGILPRIYIDIGLADPYKDTARIFELKLSEYSYPHEWHLNLGTHNEAYWSSHLVDYLRWYDLGWEDFLKR